MDYWKIVNYIMLDYYSGKKNKWVWTNKKT